MNILRVKYNEYLQNLKTLVGVKSFLLDADAVTCSFVLTLTFPYAFRHGHRTLPGRP